MPLLSDLLPHLSSLNAGPLKSHQLQGCPHSVQRPCGDLVDRIARLQLHLGAQGQVASDTHTLTRSAGWWFICSSAPCLPWGRDDIFNIKAGGRTLAPRVQLALHRPRVQGKSGPPTSYLAKWIPVDECQMVKPLWNLMMLLFDSFGDGVRNPRGGLILGMGHNFGPGGLHGFVRRQGIF